MNIFVATIIIILHTPGGDEVSVNTNLIVSLREQTDADLITDRANCLINTNDGKFITVVETCEAVRKLIGGKND